MSQTSDLDETNSTSTFTTSFNHIYLTSELKSHEEVNQKNLVASQEKIKKLLKKFDKQATIDGEILNKLTNWNKKQEELKQLENELLEQEKIIRETEEKQKILHKEYSNLKNKLALLEKEKETLDKGL